LRSTSCARLCSQGRGCAGPRQRSGHRNNAPEYWPYEHQNGNHIETFVTTFPRLDLIEPQRTRPLTPCRGGSPAAAESMPPGRRSDRTSTIYTELGQPHQSCPSATIAGCSSFCHGNKECFEPNQFRAVIHERLIRSVGWKTRQSPGWWAF